MSERFYVEELGFGDSVSVTGEEARHLARVRRIRRGQQVVLFDGSGVEASAAVRDIERDLVTLSILDRRQINRELPFSLTLGCSPAKGDRWRSIVEKATELGVTRLVPVLTEYTTEQARAVRAAKMERWVIEASKQCGRNSLMELSDPVGWAVFVHQFSAADLKLIAHRHGAAFQSILRVPNRSSCVVAIGPEGGFTEMELSEAASSGWQAMSLGDRTLRIETAALAAVALLTCQ